MAASPSKRSLGNVLLQNLAKILQQRGKSHLFWLRKAEWSFYLNSTSEDLENGGCSTLFIYHGRYLSCSSRPLWFMPQFQISNIIYFYWAIESIESNSFSSDYVLHEFHIYSMEDSQVFFCVSHTPPESDISNKGKKRPSGEHSHGELHVRSNDFLARSKRRWSSLLPLQPVVSVCVVVVVFEKGSEHEPVP